MKKKVRKIDSDDFRHRQFTLIVRFRPFLITCLKVSEGQIKNHFSRTDFDPCPQNSTTEVMLPIVQRFMN